MRSNDSNATAQTTPVRIAAALRCLYHCQCQCQPEYDGPIGGRDDEVWLDCTVLDRTAR